MSNFVEMGREAAAAALMIAAPGPLRAGIGARARSQHCMVLPSAQAAVPLASRRLAQGLAPA